MSSFSTLSSKQINHSVEMKIAEVLLLDMIMDYAIP